MAISKKTPHLPHAIAEKLYAYEFFDNFLIIYPFYSLLFADSGISPAQISLLFLAWSFSTFLLEIPAGALADKYSRKNILIIGNLAKIVGFLFWLFMQNFAGFMIGFILWGVKTAFTSGTLEAFIYDELAAVKRQKLFTKIAGRVEAYGLIGLIAGGFAASALADIGYDWILILSIASLVVSTAALALLPQSKIKKSLDETKYLEYLKGGVSLVFKKHKLLWLVAFISVMVGFAATDEYFSLFLREKGFDNTMIAILIAIICAGAATGSALAHHLEGKRWPIRSSLLGWALIIYLSTIAPRFASAFFITLYVLIFSVIQIMAMGYLQKEADDKTRATTTSVSGFLTELFALISFGVMSISTAYASYARAYQIMAAIIAVAAIALAIWARKLKLKY